MYNQYQSGYRMNEPPEIITNKDLLYLQDALSWELLASKKLIIMQRSARTPKSGSS